MRPALTSLALAIAMVVAPLLPSPSCAQANTQQVASQLGSLRVTTIATGLQNPWGLAFLPDGNYLVTERPGRLRIVTPQGGVSTPITGVPAVFARGQGGLLDVALDPQFASNRRVYLSFAEAGIAPGTSNTAGTAVFRGRLSNDGTALTEGTVIFRVTPKLSTEGHFGSRLAFDSQGLLYITAGDNFSSATAQRQNQHQGKILRIRTDGTVPTDNPFVGNSAWLPEIWSTGHRSPQGMAFHPTTGQLWMTEHGPKGGDEINRIGRGLNYGWPTITWGIGYDDRPVPEAIGTSAPGLEQPRHYWTPSIGTSGLAFYENRRSPEWMGSVFVGGLVTRGLHRLRMDADRVVAQETLLSGLNWRIRDVRVGSDGALYLLVDDTNGRLVRLEPPSIVPRAKPRPVVSPPPQSEAPTGKRLRERSVATSP